MPPWEYAEMGSVWVYLQTKCSLFYEEIRQSMAEVVEKYGSKDPGMGQDFECLPPEVQPPLKLLETLKSLEYGLDSSTAALASIGPDFVYRVIYAPPLLRRNMILANAPGWSASVFIGYEMKLWGEEVVPFLYPADRHSITDYEQLWSNLSPTEVPNNSWKTWYLAPEFPGQTFEEAIEGFTREDGWDWAHAIWDNERLERWKAPILDNLP
ncbi:uncharacterized protein N7511_002224 [Penicillium nucicola]|uniref:uncharacterized protein n=1 Tax=Penicillium nucicola TaxID=1850975 RepID=UPI002545807C|nr:uncharacterized protein N7511_002224 [Penicillium nucicola]KAJ5770173.1 hypothetical protein N7511_002224 [Penicillium nucicola]